MGFGLSTVTGRTLITTEKQKFGSFPAAYLEAEEADVQLDALISRRGVIVSAITAFYSALEGA